MSKQHLAGRLPGHKRFTRPITIMIERDTDGSYLVQEEYTIVFGYGTTRGEAIADYKHSLMESYRFLKREEHRLSPALKEELAHIRRLITWR